MVGDDVMLYMDNARKAFSEACDTFNEHGDTSNFYHKIAQMIPDRVDVDTLILAIEVALADAEREQVNLLSFIALIPQYVRQCASAEFLHEFREKFNRRVLGIDAEELSEEDYGCVEVEKDVIDISNKDRGEVLAALYNAAIPIGMGFMQYNPIPWTKEMADMYFEVKGEVNPDDGSIKFRYILGRLTPCVFKDNLVYVGEYNFNTEEGFAQKIIATVPNIKNPKKR